MKYKNAIISLGILIAVILSPFIGVPRSWKEGTAIVLALLVSVLAYISSRPKAKSVSQASASVSTPVMSEVPPSNPQ